MDMNSFFIRRHNADAERSDSIQDARDTWTLDRAQQIIEALAGMTSSGRAVYPSTLMVKPSGSKTVGGESTVSVFAEFGWWLSENSELLDKANTRDLLTNPLRAEIKLFKEFANQHAEMECGCLSDDYFADDADWEAA